MALAKLPHSGGCVVCGYDNPHGLHLSFDVETETGEVSATFVLRPEHVGFIDIIHGGVLATVIDEAMVWSATWAGQRFCVCAEMTVRFRESASVGQTLRIVARVESRRSRLIETKAEILDARGVVVAVGSGKYTPVSPERNRDVVGTLVREPEVIQALQHLAVCLESLIERR